jgi:hypothetical protein
MCLQRIACDTQVLLLSTAASLTLVDGWNHLLRHPFAVCRQPAAWWGPAWLRLASAHVHY